MILDVELFEEPNDKKPAAPSGDTIDPASRRLLEHYSVGRLYQCDNGRLGLNGHEFHCGEGFEILRPIFGTTTGRWAQVRIEHSSGWYLVGDARMGDELLGIIARRKT